MWKASPAFKTKAATLALAIVTVISSPAQEPLQTFEGCTLIPTEWADGDSFLVKLPDGREEVFRLYYVDCLEKSVSTTSDKRRLREQARYFGVEDYAIARDHGVKAAQFVIEALSGPFTLRTSFADARGRSGKPRYYAFVRTSAGQDLARLLVENGLARAFGVARETPSGTHRDEWSAYLSDLELVAAIQRAGIWAHSDPGAIARLRAEEREDARSLESIDDALAIQPPSSPVDLNSASLEDLMRTGMRESIADKVIQQRPFSSVEQLLDVHGIGPVTFDKVKPYVRVGPIND